MQDYNRRFNDNDACWLIKIETRVSGPFSFNEVLAKLTSGEIYSHHEVMQPLDRWRSLVAQPLFSAAVEKLKRQMELTPEQTMTRTERTSFTRTLDLHDRVTPTPMQNTITPPPPLAQPNDPNAPTYANYNPPARNPKKTNSLPLIIATGVIVVTAAVLLFMQKRAPSAPEKQHSTFITYVDRGLANKKVADWYEALKNFKQAHQFNPRDIDLTFEIAPLLVQIENQTMYARSMMEKVMVGQYKRENLAMGKNILGLSYAYEGQLKQAIKQYEEALANDETYLPAQINRGFTFLLATKFQDAESQLMQVLTTQADTAIASVYLLEMYIVNGHKNNDSAAFEKAAQLANQLISRRIYDGQQEILLFQAYAAFKRATSPTAVSAAEKILQRALAVDPDQTIDHMHSPLVDWRGFNWKYYQFVCRDMAKQVKGDTLSLLEFICAYKMNLEPQQAVELLMNRHRNSPLPHVAQAIVAYKQGEYEKAKDSLSLAQKLVGSPGTELEFAL